MIENLNSLIRRRRGAGSSGARSARDRDEDGFLLLESIVAISLITILMGGLASFTINVLNTTTEQRSRQGAVQLASSTMATVRSIPATDILSGRDQGSVNTQRSAASAAVDPYLVDMKMLRDKTAASGSGATAVVPTTGQTQVLNGITYTVNTYLGSCVVAGSTDCTKSAGSNDDEYDSEFGIDGKVIFTRAVVAVTWQHRSCPSSQCSYVTSTLINPDVDPIFNSNLAQPPTDPVVDPVDDQVSSVGSPVDLTLAVRSGTGVPTYTWQVTAGTLPLGLTLSASGVITGAPTLVQAATPITVTVTDAFGRTGSDTFTWTVKPPPTIVTPAAQTSTQGKPASLAVVSTCPNGPCAFALNNAPPGLSINATNGTVSGNPSTVGTWSNVTITITDAGDSAVSTAPFTWRVFPAPDASGLGALTATVGNVKSVPLSISCPTTTCTLLLTNTVPGMGLSTTTPNSTNNTTTTLTVASGNRTVYVAGTVQPSAVPTGMQQTYTPSVKITDLNGSTDIAVASAWVIYAKPTIGNLGTRSLTEGRPENAILPYTCPDTPCTITLAGTMPGLGLSTTSGATAANSTTTLTVSSTSGTVYVNGTVGATAVTTGTSLAYTPTVTIKDATNEGSTGTGAWTAYTVPTITNPGSQATEPNQNLSLQIAAACPNGGCTYLAERQTSGNATWTNVPISTSGLMTWASPAAGTYTLRVTVTDIDGASTQITIPLRVQTFTLAIPNQTTSRPLVGTKTATLNVAPLVNPVATGYNYTLTGAPSWLTISAAGVLTATVTPTTPPGSTSVTVTVTSKASATSNVATTFTWTIT
jgi:type II secretory pathway pseudopilin PulG